MFQWFGKLQNECCTTAASACLTRSNAVPSSPGFAEATPMLTVTTAAVSDPWCGTSSALTAASFFLHMPIAPISSNGRPIDPVRLPGTQLSYATPPLHGARARIAPLPALTPVQCVRCHTDGAARRRNNGNTLTLTQEVSLCCTPSPLFSLFCGCWAWSRHSPWVDLSTSCWCLQSSRYCCVS